MGGNGEYDIRWMTPTTEVDLCGHGTFFAPAFGIRPFDVYKTFTLTIDHP